MISRRAGFLGISRLAACSIDSTEPRNVLTAEVVVSADSGLDQRLHGSDPLGMLQPCPGGD
jgi:hypothetical protein